MKLSIADLSEKCYPDDVMIGKETAEFTARVKARVFAEIKKTEPNKKVVHIHPKRVITLTFAAALILSFSLVAYAISSIHAVRQQELQSEMRMDEHQTDSYVEYEVPDESVSGIVLLSTINDGSFQEVYVNVSPVSEEEMAGFPGRSSFRWSIVGSELRGLADPWIRPGSSASGYEEIQKVIRRDSYDAETQTLTLCCRINMEPLASHLEKGGSDHTELELFLVEDNTITRSFGLVSLAPTEEDCRSFDFDGATWMDEESNKEISLVGLELTPVSAVLHMRYAEAEAVYAGNDPALQQEWSIAEDSVLKNMTIIFSNGGNLSFDGFLSSSFCDGEVNAYIWWPRAIDIQDVQQIVLGNLLLWENKE